MLKKILFIILFLLISFVYSKEIILKSKKITCNDCVVDDSLTLKINPDTKDCTKL